jgi:hypothetical protein
MNRADRPKFNDARVESYAGGVALARLRGV